MKEDQAAEKERSLVQRAANYIRRDLLTFARDERFAEAFALQRLPGSCRFAKGF